jgi:hypothetical protein
MPGDVVRRLISGEESQRGFVQSCNIKCHAKVLGTEHYIYNIAAKDVKRIQVGVNVNIVGRCLVIFNYK